MNLQINYNKQPLNVHVPDAQVVGSKEIENQDGDALVLNAIQNPIDGPSLSCFIKDTTQALCIVNDADRSTPTADILHQIKKEVGHLDFNFLVAIGSHQPPSEAHLETIFGELLPDLRNRIFIHDSRNSDDLTQVGTTSRGTPVLLNKKVMDADQVIVIGSVEPHYFAGFTGGRKSFLPGTAGYESIEQNHKLALEPGVDVMALEGNPVHEDMMEAAGLFHNKSIFSIQAVLDAHDRIAAMFAGSQDASFRAGVEAAKEIFAIPVQEKFDIIVAVAEPPLDKNLYQAHKAIENVRPVLKPNGILILVAACTEGIGNDGFAKLLSASNSPDDVIRSIRASYKLGHHKASRIANLVKTARLWAVTELSVQILQPLFIEKKSDLQSALDEGIRLKPDGKILIVHAATVAVPTLFH
ncbi:nickel-dependent lactate racemase [candidate division KSB1 bacterium]|nr:nickel-dependent lactate racemase [candidate division KSB1 bacterium]